MFSCDSHMGSGFAMRDSKKIAMSYENMVDFAFTVPTM